jgi:hypothetical protein
VHTHIRRHRREQRERTTYIYIMYLLCLYIPSNFAVSISAGHMYVCVRVCEVCVYMFISIERPCCQHQCWAAIRRPRSSSMPGSLKSSPGIYIYIYIYYMCVCMCVCIYNMCVCMCCVHTEKCIHREWSDVHVYIDEEDVCVCIGRCMPYRFILYNF